VADSYSLVLDALQSRRTDSALLDPQKSCWWRCESLERLGARARRSAPLTPAAPKPRGES
jgi:hypothetical protein